MCVCVCVCVSVCTCAWCGVVGKCSDLVVEKEQVNAQRPAGVSLKDLLCRMCSLKDLLCRMCEDCHAECVGKWGGGIHV